jgi:hypothetical protein
MIQFGIELRLQHVCIVHERFEFLELVYSPIVYFCDKCIDHRLGCLFLFYFYFYFSFELKWRSILHIICIRVLSLPRYLYNLKSDFQV